MLTDGKYRGAAHMGNISGENILADRPGSRLKRFVFWLRVSMYLGAVVFAYVVVDGFQKYGRNQGNPWDNFDADKDGVFTRAEVEDLSGMDDAVFSFYDADGDGRLTRAEFVNWGWREHAKKADRALYLLQHPLPGTPKIIMNTFQLNSRIRRHSTEFFWTDPRFAPYGLDSDNDDIITKAELAAAIARGARPEIQGAALQP